MKPRSKTKIRRALSLILSILMLPSFIPSVFATNENCTGKACLCEHSICELSFAAIMGEEPNDACGISSHRPPDNYRYIGSTSGDSQLEAAAAGIAAGLVGFVPGLGFLMFTITTGVTISALLDYMEDGILYGRYYKYQWSDGTNSWYHVVWVADYDNDGYDNYVTCKVVTT